MPKKKQWPIIRPARAAEVFREMLGLRRLLMKDYDFMRMSDVWEMLERELEGTRIRRYSSEGTERPIRASVVVLDDLCTMTVSHEMMERAAKGMKLDNFTLAHELSHVALEHHARNAVVKNFQLFETDRGLANVPPNEEELEAMYAATFFQCGISLLEPDVDAVRMANRAFTDVYYVKKSLEMVRDPEFKREFLRLSSVPRVVF